MKKAAVLKHEKTERPAAMADVVFINGVWRRELSYRQDLLRGDADNGYELILPPDAKATLIEAYDGGVDTFPSLSITLKNGSSLAHGKILKNISGAAQTTLRVEKGAKYDVFTLLQGGKGAKSETDVTLAEENAEAHILGAMLLRGSDQASAVTRVTHAAPNCTSRQICKAVLDGKAKGSFKGNIVVATGAQKTDGHQLSRALLLSNQAQIEMRPDLEINADDVKCSHGSAIGDLDEQALFYLRSRGIGEKQARALLIDAFIGELTAMISDNNLRESVERETKEWLR